MRPHLLRWQYEGYPEYHRNRLNLWLHIVAVPLFVGSFLQALWCLAHLWLVQAAFSVLGMAIAFGLQAFGHGREKTPAIPFAGPVDGLSRIFVEQHVTFWRFVLSGGWWRAMRGDKGAAP